MPIGDIPDRIVHSSDSEKLSRNLINSGLCWSLECPDDCDVAEPHYNGPWNLWKVVSKSLKILQSRA
jgi:hypothetical protein